MSIILDLNKNEVVEVQDFGAVYHMPFQTLYEPKDIQIGFEKAYDKQSKSLKVHINS